MRKRIVLALLAGLALAPRTTGTVGDLRLSLDDALAGVQEAARLLFVKDRLGAIAQLDLAIGDVAGAVAAVSDPGTQAELGTLGPKVSKKVQAFAKAIDAARAAMANPNAPDLKAVLAAGKAAKMGFGAQSAYAKFPSRGPAPFEQNARSAGFHKPGATVLFKVYPGLDAEGQPCVDPPTFTVIDPYGNGSVVTGTPVSVQNPDGSYTVTVHMGLNGGPGRLKVSGCGVTRNSLLFNYGPTGTFAPKVTVDRFDGTYTGQYSGTANVPGMGSYPISGSVAFTVSGGVITVTDPGSGQGSLTAKGAAALTGDGSTATSNYTFSGKFVALQFGSAPGSATASGSFHSVLPNGTATGMWSASR